MKSLDKAKIKLLKLVEDYGYLLVSEIAEIASNFDLNEEDLDKLIAFIDKQDTTIYDSLEQAKENGEDINIDDNVQNNNLINNKTIATVSYSASDKKEPYYLGSHLFYVYPYYLKHLCDSNVFQRGIEYCENGKVISFRNEESSYCAEVLGTKKYSTRVFFGDGKIISHECNCAAHSNYSGPCKHIVAMVLFANKEINLPGLRKAKNNFAPFIRLPDPIVEIGRGYTVTNEEWDNISLEIAKRIDEFYLDYSTQDTQCFYRTLDTFFQDALGDLRMEIGDMLEVDDFSKNIFGMIEKKHMKIVDNYFGESNQSYSDYDEEPYNEGNDTEIDNGYRDDYDYSED